MSDLETRWSALIERLRTAYSSVGGSSGRPYVYFVYPPEKERAVRRMVADPPPLAANLHVVVVDLLPILIAATAGQEERRDQLLKDPVDGGGAKESILRLWSARLAEAINQQLASPAAPGRPVVVLSGTAALHPLGNPTGLMERLAEREPRDPATGECVPIVVLVPGVRPPQRSRTYWFLGRSDLESTFYRGEDA